MDAPGCPCGPDSACCGPHEYGAAATAAREAEASAASARPAALDEVCSGGYHARRCNASPAESCCGYALCRECYLEHRAEDCDALADECRRALYPDGCDCTANATVCPVHRADVEAELRRRAEGGL
jgi:hypothetical protein